MKYIEMEGLQRKVSSLIMGSQYFHQEKMEYVNEILDSFLEIGGNTIDTAFIYSGGNSEKAIGLWLKTKSPELQNFAWQNGYGIFSIGFVPSRRLKSPGSPIVALT